MIDALSHELACWQNRAYSRRYLARVAKVRAAEQKVDPMSEALTRAFALGYHKLLAYKDEYEVARLYARRAFREEIAASFEGRLQADLPFRAADHGAERRTGRPAQA